MRSTVVLFLDRCGVHRDLHSFPTRRSSDLAFIETDMTDGLIGQEMKESNQSEDEVIEKFLNEKKPFMAIRSEEHTSELQSRGHLVCRLLLEKKKEIVIQDTTQKEMAETKNG